MTGSRERLLEALVTLTSERGLDSVTIREVAAAAGVSIGTVQYYCRGKDEMLLMTFEHVAQRIIDRATGVERTGTVGDSLRRVLRETLPLDPERTRESRVYLAFAARAAVSPDLARVQHEILSQLRAHLTEAFAYAAELGEARGDEDPARVAATTAALVDGLLLHILTDPGGLSEDEAGAILDDHLARYLTG